MTPSEFILETFKLLLKKGSEVISMEFHLMATDLARKYLYKLIYVAGNTKQIRP